MVPRAGVGVHFLIAERVVGPEPQTRARLEQADPVDPALGFGHMFLEAPAQAAVEIELPVEFGLVFAFAGLGVVARGIEQGRVDRDRIGKPVQVAGVEVDHEGQDGVAAFLHHPCRHFADAAILAERVEQVFAVVAVMQPLARRLVDQGVDHVLRDVGAAGGFSDGVKGPFDPLHRPRRRYPGVATMKTARKPRPNTWSIVLPTSVRSSQITTAKGPFPSSVRSA
jgi:hypothetical protein